MNRAKQYYTIEDPIWAHINSAEANRVSTILILIYFLITVNFFCALTNLKITQKEYEEKVGYKIVRLNDGQGILIDGDKYDIN